MRKILSALALCFIFVASTAAHITEPIKPIDESLFRPIDYPDYDIEVVIPVGHGEKRATGFETVLPKVAAPSIKPAPTAKPVRSKPPTQTKQTTKGFKLDHEVSWYGPGFYGRRTACGQKYTKTILGVAHRTLPCGTKVTFRWKGRTITVPVIDRGPYVSGRQWDLSGGLCVALHHCFTGKIYYRIGK
jgi:rare lipoprotein A (peptidoglycan hydrolase)